MLLCNFVVEVGLFNGAIGTIVDIVYTNKDGPRSDYLPSYIVVNFELVSIPLDQCYDISNPKYIPIPVKAMRCESGCCVMTTIPLQVCKAISIYKCQGMTVGASEMFTKIVVMLPGIRSRMNIPGMHMVAISRIKESSDISFISNDANLLTYESIMSIGKSKSYQERKLYKEKVIGQKHNFSMNEMRDTFKPYSRRDVPTVSDGYNNLVQWYRNLTT